MSNQEIQKSERSDIVPAADQRPWVPAGMGVRPGETLEGQSSHLWDYLSVVWRRRWLVFLIFLLSLAWSVNKVIHEKPRYRARAKIEFRLPDSEPSAIGNKPDVSPPGPDIPTEVEILQSRELAERVVLRMNLFAPAQQDERSTASAAEQLPPAARAVRFFGKTLGSIKGLLREPEKVPVDRASDELRARVDAFLWSLDVRPVEKTRIVYVSFEGSDPQRAADIVNCLCDEYSTWTLQSNAKAELDVRRRTENWLTDELKKTRAALEEARRKVSKFKRAHNISVSTASLEDLRQKALKDEEELQAAQRRLFEAQIALKHVATSPTAAVIHDDQQVSRLKADLQVIDRDLASKQADLGDEHPDVRRLKLTKARLEMQLQEAIRDAKKRLEEERRVAVARQKAAIEKAQAEVDFLQNRLRSQEKEVALADTYLSELTSLNQDVQTLEKQRDGFIERLQKIQVSPFPQRSPVKVIERATLPKAEPPNVTRNLVMGGFLGLFLGVGLVLFLDYMDTKLKTPAELERLFRLPTLGYIPHLKNGKRRSAEAAEKRIELIAHQQPESHLAECFRYLRTSVQYSQAGGAPRTIVVTSALEGEGKTTVASNLAIAYAQKGKRVLLLDSDINHPSVHRIFETDRSPGLTEILVGDLDETIGCNPADPFRPTQIKNLFLLPSGVKVPNPVDLLDSNVMRDLLVLLNEEYETIIIDSAPLLLRADTSVLLPYVDGVVLVARSGVTPKAAVRRAKDRVLAMQGRILGVVINNPKRDPGHMDPYGYGYDLGYGYRHDLGRRQPEEGKTAIAEAASSVEKLPSPSQEQTS